MVSDSFEFRTIRCVRGEQEFLEHDWVNSKTNATLRLGRKELNRRRITLEISDYYVCIKEYQRSGVRAAPLQACFGIGHLFH